MKKTIYKAFSVTVAAGLVLLVNACLKDDPHFVDFSKVTNTVEFLDQTPGKATSVSFVDPNSASPDTLHVRVHQAGPSATSVDLTCNIAVSQAGLDMYNLDQAHVVGTPLDPSAFSFPSSVTIKAGKDELGNDNRTVEFDLIIIPNKVPQTLGVNYVLALGISSVSPETTVSANNGVIVFNFYKNIYDGSYHRTGSLQRQAAPPIPPPDVINEDDDLVTINATTSTTIASYFQNTTLSFFVTVNSDNSVSIDADPNAGVVVSADGPCSYDPTLKKFIMKYKYNNGTYDRNFNEVWVLN